MVRERFSKLCAAVALAIATPSVGVAQDSCGVYHNHYMEIMSRQTERYVVQKGDNLTEIALEFYGDSSRVDSIVDYNRLFDPDFNPDLIFPGQVLEIPLEEELRLEWIGTSYRVGGKNDLCQVNGPFFQRGENIVHPWGSMNPFRRAFEFIEKN